MNASPWIEAMRLRTLPVSVAGVLAGIGYARLLVVTTTRTWLIFVICLAFAVTAQIASNFANEYFDYKSGIDSPGRQGPRRGVTEGDISVRSMKFAIFGTLAVAAALGLVLVAFGGWIILVLGVLIVLGVLAYSAGPLPFSRNCLGEVAAIAFFGLAPVCISFFLYAGYVDPYAWSGGLALGLMSANVLLVNNIRDIADDRRVSKHTLASVFGRRFGSFLYLANGWLATWLVGSAWLLIGGAWLIVPSCYLFIHTVLWYMVDRRSRNAVESPDDAHTLTPLLGMSACLMLVYSLFFAIAS